MPALVRLATDADLGAAGEVTVAAYEPFVGAGDPYLDRLRAAGTRAAEAELWVALDPGGLVVGTVTGCPPGSPWREVARPGEGELRMLAVHPAAQRGGVGESLVRHVLDRCAQRGDTAVVLSSLPGMTAAHRLYERLGFVRRPGRDWSPAPGVGLVCFDLDLDGVAATGHDA